MSKKKLVIVEDRLDRVANYADELSKDGVEIEKILICRGKKEFETLANAYIDQPFFKNVKRVDSWDFFEVLDDLYSDENILFLFDLCLEREEVEFFQKLTIIYILGKIPLKDPENVTLKTEYNEAAARFYVYTTQSEQAKEQLANLFPNHVLDTSLTSEIFLLYRNNQTLCEAVGIGRW